MRVKKQQTLKFLSLLIIFSLIIPFNFSKAFAAGRQLNASHANVQPLSQKTAVTTGKAEVSSKLKDQFAKDKYITYLLKFKDQADAKKAAAKALKLSKQKKLSAAKIKYAERSAVISALRAKAIDTQPNVIKYLKKEQKAGHVKNYHAYYVVNGIAVTSSKEVMDKLASFPEIEKILPNETRHLLQGVNSKNFQSPFNSKRNDSLKTIEKSNAEVKTENHTKGKTSQDDDAVEPNVKHIGAPQVWDMGVNGSGVVIGSLDTGVQWDHPALKKKYRGYNPGNPNQPINEYNWFDATGGNQDAPYDDFGHGTHTVGTMVGSEDDGTNEVGVAPEAQWIAAKAFTSNGTGTDADILAAGEWLLAPTDADGNPHPEKAPDIINNSWGGGAGLNELYRPMVQSWRAAGIFPTFSAGNVDSDNPGGPGSVASPGNFPESFAVGATDNNDNLASFSLQGPSPYDEIKPEVVAPGVAIRSAVPESNYGSDSGTSMAAPAVSGTVALLLQANASLTVDDIENILINTAKPLTDITFPKSPNNGYGHGLIQAFQAVSSVTSGLGTVKGTVSQEGEDTEPPTYKHEAPDQVYSNMDIPLEIRAQDNVVIENVDLQYRGANNDDWQTIEAQLVEGNYQDGVYDVTIPKEAVKIPSIEYRWKIADYGGNDVTTDIYKVEVKPGITTGYKTDFETPPVGWTSYGLNNCWEWGQPTSGPGKAFSGDKVYGTKLGGAYPTGFVVANLQMPPIDLSDGETYLQFKQWYSLYAVEIGGKPIPISLGYVYISTDQENWTRLGEFGGDSNGWIDGEINLSQYAGQRVYINFQLASLENDGYPGWYLDDVSLSDTSMSNTNKAHLGGMGQDQINQTLKIIKAGKNNKKTPKQLKKLDQIATKLADMKPGKPKNVKTPFSSHKPVKLNKTKARVSSLPLNATVSVEGTGISTKTNPRDGHYLMSHPVGTYTLEADAYGFYSQSRTVDIPRDGAVDANFTLQPIPKGTITGQVTDKSTGKPVAGATVMLMEDPAIAPVKTDENGHYSITAYEGDYTLHVTASKYHGKDIDVTIKGDDSTEKNVQLKPFVGTPGEIGYDDGTAENAHAYNYAGNRWGVRMSLPEGHNSAMVTGGKFLFWNDDFPSPGGNKFKVEIWDASGQDGAPGKKLAGPVDATAIRDKTQWTTVDLSGLSVVVHGDFYMVYVQPGTSEESPGLATDESSPNAGRGWQKGDGDWSPAPESQGNYMIRATVSYELSTPVITSPKNDLITNDSTLTVKGDADKGTEVNIMDNGDKVATVKATDDGKFSATITLKDGENALTATASSDAGETEPSDPVIVTLDQDKPVLAIDSPADRSKTNKDVLTVRGTVLDANLDWVKVNGQKATVNDDGTYSKRILLDEGENRIKVVAQDKAGNKRTKTITVEAKFTTPKIENLKPAQDTYLNAGDTVTVEFTSDPGMKATYVIQMPLTNSCASLSSVNEFPMMEIAPGHYMGWYTATSNIRAAGAQIEVKATDDYGNEIRKTADGKLYINVSK
ncbi:S8 family serine peptidase [Camelliibacillus cellulosilyticus]|uniref:S8 family serine peptidase n=1 Tax=Camelliibacillus cellulosilyticus TaxID=2174486 RepID=A0ABV9GRQ8_9BACL